MKLKELIPATHTMLARLAENGGTMLVIKHLDGAAAVYINSNERIEALFGPEEFEYAEHEGLVRKTITNQGGENYSITPKGRAFVEEMTSVDSLVNSAKGLKPGDMNVNIQRFEGLLNTGRIVNNRDITISIRTIRDNGAPEVAEALEKLSTAVKEDELLDQTDKEEALARIELLGNAIASEEKDRPAKFQIKDSVKGLAEVIKTGSSSATLWHYIAPTLGAALGISL